MSGDNFTADEVKQLAVAWPELVAEGPGGHQYATVTRTEFRSLVSRYPTHFNADPPPRNPRYPSMT